MWNWKQNSVIVSIPLQIWKQITHQYPQTKINSELQLVG